MAGMAADYYAVLGLQPGCSEAQIKRAYHKLAVKYHPDKARAEDGQQFQELREAYEVLVDPKRRAQYDSWRPIHFAAGCWTSSFGMHGAPRFEAGAPPRSAKCGRASAFAGFAACSAAFQQHFQKEFYGAFGTLFGEEAAEGTGERGAPRSSAEPAPAQAAEPSGPVPHGADGAASARKKDGAIEVPLHCTLEELYHGTTKRMRVERQVLGPGDVPSRRSEILTIQVLPGWRAGTCVTFCERGDQRPGRVPADLVFVVSERPHDVFSRRGADLHCTRRLALVDALCGCSLALSSLDGRELGVQLPACTAFDPGATVVVPGEGMPTGKGPLGARGDLHITLEVEFPSQLPPGACELLRAALPAGEPGGKAAPPPPPPPQSTTTSASTAAAKTTTMPALPTQCDGDAGVLAAAARAAARAAGRETAAATMT